MVQIWRWVSWMMTIFKKIFRRIFILRKFLANNSTILASISYIFAMCLALCFTNILFKFLDHPMGSESLSPLYKYRTESQRGKWLALCHTSLSNGRTRVQTYVHLTPSSFWYISLPPWASPEAISERQRNCLPNAGDVGLIPGLGWSPGEGNSNPLLGLYSWREIPRTEEPGGL